MFESAIVALAVFGISFIVLNFAEGWWHKQRHNADRSYRWGVWVFSILAALYAFAFSFGR